MQGLSCPFEVGLPDSGVYLRVLPDVPHDPCRGLCTDAHRGLTADGADRQWRRAFKRAKEPGQESDSRHDDAAAAGVQKRQACQDGWMRQLARGGSLPGDGEQLVSRSAMAPSCSKIGCRSDPLVLVACLSLSAASLCLQPEGAVCRLRTHCGQRASPMM